MKRLAVCPLLACLASFQASGQSTITAVAGSGRSGFSGDGGPATLASLATPNHVAVDSAGNLFIADQANNRIRKVSPSGIITTVAGGGSGGLGDGGPATAASLIAPGGIAVDASGNLFVSDSGNNVIRKVSAGGIITTVAGGGSGGLGDGGPATAAGLATPLGLTVDSSGNIFFADNSHHRIRKISSNGIITTVAGNGATFGSGIFVTGGFSGDGGPATAASLDYPQDVALDASGNLYIADEGNFRIRKVSGGIITTVAGGATSGLGDGGPATAALLAYPYSVAADASGNIFIADTYDYRVRKVSGSGGMITTVAGDGVFGSSGDGGPATAASLGFTNGIAVDASGNLYINDGTNRIREVRFPPGPSIATGGIVPVDSTVATIQAGEWVSIYGANLASSKVTWNGDFPPSLGGTSVTINGRTASLSFVSPTQINLQAPDDPSIGPVPVVVTTAAGTATSTVTLAQFAPSFLLLDSKHVAGIILRSNGSGAYGGGTYDIIGPSGNSLGYPTVAAKAGDFVELFAVGFGPTDPVVPPGQTYSGAAPTINTVNLLLGNVSVTPAFAGLSSAGLYQINLTIPSGLGAGEIPLLATVGGVQSPGAVISLQ